MLAGPAFLISVLLFFLLAGVSCGGEKEQRHLPPYSIGYIPFSAKLDDPAFELCNEKIILENNYRMASYRGGVKSVLDYFQPVMKKLPLRKGETGYLTVRFVMNCEGEKNRYRILGINERYKPKEFPTEISNTILEAVKQMDGWQVAVYQGTAYDSFNMLTFKMADGQITDIIL